MAIQFQGNNGVVADVGGAVFRAVNVNIRPIDYASLGHYRVFSRVMSTAAQAANSRLFELRNNGSNFIVPTRLILRAMQVAAGTAQENSIDVYRCTNFTAVDTTNAATPNVIVKRVGAMVSAPGSAQVRSLNANAAGMTGGTMTKDAGPITSMPYNVAAAINTTSIIGPLDCFDDVNGTHPFVLAQNEGLVLENRVLNVTSYGIAWFIDLSWAEVASY